MTRRFESRDNPDTGRSWSPESRGACRWAEAGAAGRQWGRRAQGCSSSTTTRWTRACCMVRRLLRWLAALNGAEVMELLRTQPRGSALCVQMRLCCVAGRSILGDLITERRTVGGGRWTVDGGRWTDPSADDGHPRQGHLSPEQAPVPAGPSANRSVRTRRTGTVRRGELRGVSSDTAAAMTCIIKLPNELVSPERASATRSQSRLKSQKLPRGWQRVSRWSVQPLTGGQ